MQRRCAAIAIASVLLLLVPRMAAQPADGTGTGGDPLEILAGITEIAAPGTPGSVVVFGEHAVPLIAGRTGKNVSQLVVAAATLETGRVVALGHSGYLSSATARTADTGRLLCNAVRWAGADPASRQGTTIAVVGGDLAEYLKEQGFTAATLRPADLRLDANHFSVIVLSSSELTDEQVEGLSEYVRRGGGLVVAQTGWGWQQLNGGKDVALNPCNRVLAPAGLAFSDGTVEKTGKDSFVVGPAASEFLHAGRTVGALLDQSAGRLSLSDGASRQAVETATLALRTLPADDRVLRPRLAPLLENGVAARVPSHAQPVRETDGLTRLLITMQLEDLKRTPSAEVRAHPGAAEFPGLPTDGVATVERTVSIDTTTPGWHSLGLYAPPGGVVTAELAPADAVSRAGLHLRIGCHTDSLWHADSWQRMPEIARRIAIKGPNTLAASPFGGLIYLDVPAGCKAGMISLTTRGGIEAPLFTLGSTSAADWRERIRGRPGPWAELAGRKIIVTVPSAAIRDLDDPGPVLELWDRIADADADLAAIPHERARPERYVADVQISAGYMHSGYPIMTHLDAAPAMVSLDKLKAGQWGLFHELGHNHQDGMWTFAGTGEVTCNLFSMYIIEEVCGLPKENGHGGVADRADRIRKYFEKPATFERWSADPFTALVMYAQLRDAFGWEAYKRVFAEYRALPPDQCPRTDEQKRDQWLVRLSRTVNRDLGPFFTAWGVPTTDAARESIKDLPAWMPADMPPPSVPGS